MTNKLRKKLGLVVFLTTAGMVVASFLFGVYWLRYAGLGLITLWQVFLFLGGFMSVNNEEKPIRDSEDL